MPHPGEPGWWLDLINDNPSDVTPEGANYLNALRLGKAVMGQNFWIAKNRGMDVPPMSDQRLIANMRFNRETLNATKSAIENATGVDEMNRTKSLGPSGVPSLHSYLTRVMEINPITHPLHRLSTHQFFTGQPSSRSMN